MTGRLLGIARRAAPRAPNVAVAQARVGLGTGVAGNFRGTLRPGKSNRRQVSILLASDWAAATAELGVTLDWALRRCDLFVDGIYLPRARGYRVRIGGAMVEVTGECDPCSRMERITQGLEAALMPDWRGGRLARVVGEGEIRVGDAVAIEEGL